LADFGARLRRFERSFVLGLLLSVSSGYTLFLGVFPTIAFPPSSEASIVFLILIEGAAAVVVGFAADELPTAVAIGLLSIFGGIAVASLMAWSPVLEGLSFYDPSAVPDFLLHYGIIFILLNFGVNLAFVLVGYALRERYIIARPLPVGEPRPSYRK
jgi:hypothetical protein